MGFYHTPDQPAISPDVIPGHCSHAQELGLAIGAERHLVDGIGREWLFWYDEAGYRHPTPSDRADLESQRAELESQRADTEALARRDAEQAAEALRQRLRSLGIDPDLG